MIAPWPEADPMRQDAEIEAQFARFQEVLRAVRDIRARQGVAPKTPLAFSVRCDAAAAELLAPMEPYFASMANATRDGLRARRGRAGLERPRDALPGMDVYVDLAGPDRRRPRSRGRSRKWKSSPASSPPRKRSSPTKRFVDRAPADVVQKERDSLKDLQDQLATAQEVLKSLKAMQK